MSAVASVPATIELAPDFRYCPAYLDREGQMQLLSEVRTVCAEAPLYRPTMPRSGTPFSVLMSNCGPLGWVSDREGYRYAPTPSSDGKSLAAPP